MLESALDAGEWNAGEAIPTEHQLAQACGCSVGTVQRAIRDLVSSGDLKRTAGRGTFVIRNSYRLAEPFTNTRFLNDEGTGILPVRATFLGRSRLQTRGPWDAALRSAPGNVLRIERLFDVASEFRVLSRFHIDAARFPEVAELSIGRLRTANLKWLMARTYRLPEITHEQSIRFRQLDPDVAEKIGVRRGTVGILQVVSASISSGDVVYYHELHIPPNERALELPRIVLRRGTD